MKFLSLVLLFCMINSVALHGQILQSLHANIEFKSMFADDAPLWMSSKHFGTIDRSGNSAMASFHLQKVFLDRKIWDWNAGAKGISRLSDKSAVFFDELYIEGKAGPIRLYVGKKHWQDGVWHSPNSVGSMVWSGNAPTMPKIMAYIPNYLGVPFTKGWFSFKGYFGHGWFEDDRFVEDSFLHEKAFYVRLFPDRSPFHFESGIVHNVQWAGTSSSQSSLPSSFTDFIRIVTGSAGDGNSAPGGEVINALGNTVGAIEGIGTYRSPVGTFKFYHQFFIETSVSVRFRSPIDGVWGLSWEGLEREKKPVLSHFVYEYVDTRRQNAKFVDGERNGADQYYHNFIYRSGWTFHGQGIGLALADFGTRPNGEFQVINNIFIAHNVGLKGFLPFSVSSSPVSYSTQVTFRRSYGRTTNCPNDFCPPDVEQPLRTPPQDQWFTVLSLSTRLSDQFNLGLETGFDFGNIFTRSGLAFRLTYSLF